VRPALFPLYAAGLGLNVHPTSVNVRVSGFTGGLVGTGGGPVRGNDAGNAGLRPAGRRAGPQDRARGALLRPILAAAGAYS
jgi:hypothetical protein